MSILSWKFFPEHSTCFKPKTRPWALCNVFSDISWNKTATLHRFTKTKLLKCFFKLGTRDKVKSCTRVWYYILSAFTAAAPSSPKQMHIKCGGKCAARWGAQRMAVKLHHILHLKAHVDQWNMLIAPLTLYRPRTPTHWELNNIILVDVQVKCSSVPLSWRKKYKSIQSKGT